MNSLEVIGSNPEAAQFYLQQSQYFLDLGDVDRALAAIDRALTIDAKFVAGLSQIASIYQQQKKLDLAIKYYQKVITLQPTNHQAYANLGQNLLIKNRIDDAILVYKKALSIADAPVDIYSGLALALEQNGQPKKAIALYKYTITLFPNRDELRARLAQCIAQQEASNSNNISEAAIKPYSYFFDRGRQLIARGQYDEAIAVYAAGNKHHELNPFSYMMLGNAYGFTDSWKQQLECYRQAVQLDLSNFKLNLKDQNNHHSILNKNQINTVYQKVILGATKYKQTNYLLLLSQIASQRLENYTFFLETARQLTQLEFVGAAIAFLEQAKIKSLQSDCPIAERESIKAWLTDLRSP